jgi:hypothetical protein
LRSILERKPDESLKLTKDLFNEIFAQSFVNEIDKNGILRYNSLSGPEENVQYWGLLYENAPQSGVYENFSLVIFPDNSKNPEQLLLCYGIGTGGITDDASWLSIPWVKRSIKLLLRFIKLNELIVEDTEVFVKDDITDEYTEIPESIKEKLGNFKDYKELWKKYGKYLPSVCV